MGLLPPEKAVLHGSLPGDSGLSTSTLVDFIARSPGTSCKKTSDRRRATALVPHWIEVLTCTVQDNESRILVDNIDPADHLRGDRVNESVSRVSRLPHVRQIVSQKLHDCADGQDVVIEGRDIGSVVFRDTPYKFYIDASPEVRLQRRAAQGERDEIAIRDHDDVSRALSPLVIATDAQVIDTSHVTIEQVVDEIIARLKKLGLAISDPPLTKSRILGE